MNYLTFLDKSDLYFGALSSISNTSELQANVSTTSRKMITELDNDLKNETEKIVRVYFILILNYQRIR